MKKEMNSYEEMASAKPAFENCESAEVHPSFQNDYEKNKWNSNGFDQSGFE